MEVRPGYKLTEVGVIPEEWETPALGSLTVLMTNGFVGTATSHYVSNEKGVLYIQGYNVEENAFNFHGVKFVNENFHRAHMKSCLRGGDLLTVQTGEVGQTTIVTDSLAGSNCHALIISRFDRKQVFPAFISQYLNSKPGRSRLRLIETGTTMKHLNVGDMLHFAIPLPPTLAEQEAIAEALSDTDTLIESLEQLLTKKRQIKKGAMQELLTGKKRLPDFSGEWETTTLGGVADIRNGATPSTQITAYWNGSIPWCTPSDVTSASGKYLITTERSITGEGLTSCAASLLPAGALLLCSRATIGEIKIAASLVCTNQGFKSLVCKNGVSNQFLYYLLVTLKPQMIERASGSTFLEIGKRDVAAIEVRSPPYSEQTAIATILSDMDAEIAAVETKLSKARQIKQGMMQELLTGRIRLI